MNPQLHYSFRFGNLFLKMIMYSEKRSSIIPAIFKSDKSLATRYPMLCWDNRKDDEETTQIPRFYFKGRTWDMGLYCPVSIYRLLSNKTFYSVACSCIRMLFSCVVCKLPVKNIPS